MQKVTGIGGFFFKSKDPEKLNKWYEDNLGIPRSDPGKVSGGGGLMRFHRSFVLIQRTQDSVVYVNHGI